MVGMYVCMYVLVMDVYCACVCVRVCKQHPGFFDKVNQNKLCIFHLLVWHGRYTSHPWTNTNILNTCTQLANLHRICRECLCWDTRHGYKYTHTNAGGEAAFTDYAEKVCAEIQTIAQRNAQNPGNTLSMFGHAVFLNAVALAIAKSWGADDVLVQKILQLDLGEAEGIMIERAQQGSSCQVKHFTVRPHELW